MRMAKFKSWQDLFERAGEHQVKLYFYGDREAIDLEELFQHFRARMLEEEHERRSMPSLERMKEAQRQWHASEEAKSRERK
jgi:hypothetical protein